MKRLLLFTTCLFLFLFPSAYATMGIGISPTKLDVFFADDDDEVSFKVKVINSGNTNLKINISSKLDISPDKNLFILQACYCKNYCDIHVVGCDALYPPDEITITLGNPRKPTIEYITFSGSLLIEGGMVAVGVSAKMRINITYHGESPTSEDDPEQNEENVIFPLETGTTSPSLPPTETTSTTTVSKGVVEPEQSKDKPISTHEKEQAEPTFVKGESEFSIGDWVENNQLIILGSIGAVGVVSATGFVVKRKKAMRKIIEEEARPQPLQTQYPVTMSVSRETKTVSFYPQSDSEPIIIDETKKK